MRNQLMICSVFFFAACAGDAPPSVNEGDNVTYVDSDGDGQGDGVDVDGDGQPDFSIPSCPTCLPGQSPVCTAPLVDSNGDGIADGIDIDCDGVIDIPFDSGGGGGGGSTSKCTSTVTDNTSKKSVTCTSENGGEATCECRVDDVLVETCTNPTNDCSIGAGSGCCGF